MCSSDRVQLCECGVRSPLSIRPPAIRVPVLQTALLSARSELNASARVDVNALASGFNSLIVLLRCRCGVYEGSEWRIVSALPLPALGHGTLWSEGDG